ncbi:acetolactate synthase large subunit [Methanobrevibacter cuticularis]|uniref:Acetolactate synthase n=1 Tax=Methanobrevibacter cuticularis TaxID=47311 RepID=A0A166CM77_9EURY|nr:acetolactate synthase large subunit [Methanobrevibacter cuticularis]KZX14658.1 acetolactate synthase large subunit [Methanobrevibacter cuticularis]
MRGGEAIIKALIEQGTDTIFGYPGGQVLPLYDMLYDADLRHILVRHEQAAAHAADGYARASGKVGVCVATSGPGATNLITGIATAHMDSSPVVAISGQVPTQLIGKDAFQEVDMLGLAMPITKHAYQPKNSNEIPSAIKKSFELAISGRPGPVVIDVPKDVQEQELDYYSTDLYITSGYNPTTKGNLKQIRKAIKLIANSEKPIILVGGGLIIAGASEELKTFSQLINAPITTTLMGKGAFPEDEENYLGMVGMHGRKASNLSIDESDCLIAIGCRFSDRTTGRISDFAKNAKIIHVDIDPAEIGKNIDVDVPIVGDAKNVLNSLISTIKELNASQKEIIKVGEVSQNWFTKTIEFKNSCIPRVSYSDIPLKPQQVIKEIAESLNQDSIITTDVGQHQMWMAHFYNTTKPRKFISSGGLGTMGFGFPSAIGAKVAMPDNNVLAVTGDGGFLMVCQDLATIKENDIPVVICLFDNRKLGMVYQWQNLFYDKRLSHTDLGELPDFMKLAESFNINAEKVEKPGETKEALKNALKSGEPTLLDIVIDKSETLPMIPPGCGITEILGDYKTEDQANLDDFKEEN